MPNDKWGLPFFYPPKSGGFSWFQKDDIKQDEHYESDEVTSSGGGSFTIHFNGPTAGAIYTDRAFENTNSIGGCNMDFAATEKRGYIYKPNDPRDVEIKFIVNFGSGFSDNGFSVSGPTGSHSGSGCCSGFAYMFNMEPGTNPADFRFRKEMWHVSYHDDPKTGTFTHPKANFRLIGRNVGIGYVRYNKKDGRSAGHDSVIIEGWFNPDPDDDPTNWIMLKRTEDKGGWGNDGDDCNGVKDQVGTWGGPKYRMKSNADSANATFKHLSFREIDPNGSFDDDPTTGGGSGGGTGGGDPTTPTEVAGLLTIQYDINTYRTSACSPGGSIVFYESPRDEIDNTSSWTFNAETSAGVTRSRIGMIAKTSTGTLCNQPPLQEADFWLWKEGSPTGTLTVRIRNSNGTIKATMGTLDVATLTTSPVLIPFINLANTYVMVAGDYLLAEYSGGDDTNFVRMGKRNSLSFTSGVATKAVYYNTFPATDVYVETSTSEIAGKLWN